VEMITARSITFLKFSYVPRPMIAAQGIHCCRWNRLNHPVHAPGKLLREVPHQERNIPLAFRQGGTCTGKTFKRKKRSDRKLLLAHHRFQIAVRRSNQTCTRPKRARASQPLELPLLQDAEQFGLHSRGISPISSRKIVPPSATSKRPMRCAIAPVNAPLSCRIARFPASPSEWPRS